MTLSKSFPTDLPAGLPVADTRLVVAGMVETDTTGKPRAGVFASHYNPLVTGTTGMAYSVAAFTAATVRSGQGAEIVANDGAVSVATTAAPGANSRIDVIWVRAQFSTYADGSSVPVFGVTQGTASASPAKPAIPAGALELATATILSTTTQTSTVVITQTHMYTAMEGGVVPVRGAAELAAWSPADGAVAWRIDVGRYVDRVGGVWVTRGASCHVRMSVDGASSGTANTYAVVGWDVEDFDTDAMHDNVTNNSRLTAPANGLYLVSAKLRFGSTAYAAGVALGKNGIPDLDSEIIATQNGYAGSYSNTQKLFYLAAGEYVQVFSKAQASSLAISADRSYAEMVRVG